MARTRGKGDGGMYRDANGYYTASIELKTSDGTRRPRKVVRAKTKAALLEKLPRVRKELEETGKKWTPTQTVAQFLTYWINDVAAPDIRPKTLATYRSILKNHIVPVVGRVRLSALDTEHVRRVHDAIKTKGLSPETSRHAHRILSSALSAAEREDRIARNPAKKVTTPRGAPTKLETLTLDEAQAVTEAAGNAQKEDRKGNLIPDPLPPLWAAFILTGARRGELLGLQWDRVTDHLDLQWQLQRHPQDMSPPSDYEYHHLTTGLFLTRPKSRAGTRSIPLVGYLMHVMDEWRKIAPENPYNLVFAMPGGRPIDPDYATKMWTRNFKKSGVDKRVRLHDLRHTAIDLMVEAGVPEHIVMQVVGHTTLAMLRAYRSPSARSRVASEIKPFADLFTPQSSETLELTE